MPYVTKEITLPDGRKVKINVWKSVFDGEQIDNTLGRVINGEIDAAVNKASAFASEAKQHANTAGTYAANAAARVTEARQAAMDAQAQADRSAQERARAATEADRAEKAAIRQPYIGDKGTWMVWDTSAGSYRDTGIDARGPTGPIGPAGPQGIQGPQGEQGPQGVSGAVVTVSGLYGFEVSPEGMLSVVYEDGASPPNIELGEDGHLYINIGEETA